MQDDRRANFNTDLVAFAAVVNAGLMCNGDNTLVVEVDGIGRAVFNT